MRIQHAVSFVSTMSLKNKYMPWWISFFSLTLASVHLVSRGIPETSDCSYTQGPCLALVLLISDWWGMNRTIIFTEEGRLPWQCFLFMTYTVLAGWSSHVAGAVKMSSAIQHNPSAQAVMLVYKSKMISWVRDKTHGSVKRVHYSVHSRSLGRQYPSQTLLTTLNCARGSLGKTLGWWRYEPGSQLPKLFCPKKSWSQLMSYFQALPRLWEDVCTEVTIHLMQLPGGGGHNEWHESHWRLVKH